VTHRRYDHIDSLRGIAALMVILLHATEAFHAYLPERPISAIFTDVVMKYDFGRAGVVLFFAISGFVIPGSLRRDDPWSVFPLRRFLRLYPAYWVSLAMGLVFVHWLWGRHPGLLQIAANVTMLQQYFGLEDVLGIYWTLQVELAFYVFCFCLCSLGILADGRVLAGIALASGLYWYIILATGLGQFHALLPIRPPLSGYYLEFFAYLSVMCLGASCRRIQAGHTAGLLLTCLTIILWLVVQPLTGLSIASKGIVPDFVALKYGGYAIGLWTFFCFGFALKIQHPVAAWLGRISYSLYLQHPAVMYALLWVVTSAGWAARLNVWVWVALNIGVTVGLAGLLYRFVEAPSIALSDRLTQRLRQRIGLAVASSSPGGETLDERPRSS
jgi:peptidoglycan/LPS O-acetylase OafA/YrhL